MKFSTVVEQVLELLQRQRRISYRALKREFDLDDEYIEDLKTELIKAKRLARDEDGIVLVWTGEGTQGETENRRKAIQKLPVVSSQLPVPPCLPLRRLRTPDFGLRTLTPRR